MPSRSTIHLSSSPPAPCECQTHWSVAPPNTKPHCTSPQPLTPAPVLKMLQTGSTPVVPSPLPAHSESRLPDHSESRLPDRPHARLPADRHSPRRSVAERCAELTVGRHGFSPESACASTYTSNRAQRLPA